MRWRPLVVGGALCLLSAPWWSDFLGARDAISASLAAQSYGGGSAWGTWLMVPTVVALAVLWRRGAEWLAVPAIWPYTQLHYSALALPVAAKNAFVALALCFAVPFAAPLATIVYAVWVVAESRLVAYRLGVGEDRTVRVRVDLAPAGGRQARGERLVGLGHDDERDVPRLQLGLPAIDAVDDVLVRVPDAGREELDPRIDADRQVGQGELEPRAPRLRVEDVVARPRLRPKRTGDAGRSHPDDAARRLETGFDRAPDRQQGDAGERR